MKRFSIEYDEQDNELRLLDNGKTIYFKNFNNGYSDECTYDDSGNVLTYKNSNGFSSERTRDKLGNVLTYKNSDGFSSETTRDKFGKVLTYKDSDGYSYKCTRDNLGNELTYTVNGKLIRDNRVKKVELTMQEIADKFDIDINNLKIKK